MENSNRDKINQKDDWKSGEKVNRDRSLKDSKLKGDSGSGLSSSPARSSGSSSIDSSSKRISGSIDLDKSRDNDSSSVDDSENGRSGRRS